METTDTKELRELPNRYWVPYEVQSALSQAANEIDRLRGMIAKVMDIAEERRAADDTDFNLEGLVHDYLYDLEYFAHDNAAAREYWARVKALDTNEEVQG